MNNETYTTLVETSVYDIYKSFGMLEDILTCNAYQTKVYWELQPEARERGIKSISIIVYRVTTTIEWSVYPGDCTPEEYDILKQNGGDLLANGDIEGIIELDISNADRQGWGLSHELEFATDGAIMPYECEINFNDKTITIL